MRRRLRPAPCRRVEQSGMTLIEATLAIAVLAIGMLGVVSLLGNVSAAGRNSAFHNIALDVFTAFASEVQNAPCDFTPGIDRVDSGFVPAWVDTPQPGSGIVLVGPIDASRGATAPVTVAYRAVRNAGDCAGGGAVCTYPDSYTVQVHVCDLSDPSRPCTLDPANGYGSGYWIRSFELTKTCSIRLDDIGRGEFY